MPIDLPPRGSVVTYPYLWLHQARRGETEGRKDRPCCLILSVKNEVTAEHHLLLLAISSQHPADSQQAIEIPDIERRRAGLSRYPSAWIVTSEFNYDIAERSFYLDLSERPLGCFSAQFLKQVAQALQPTLARGGQRVSRTE